MKDCQVLRVLISGSHSLALLLSQSARGQTVVSHATSYEPVHWVGRVVFSATAAIHKGPLR